MQTRVTRRAILAGASVIAAAPASAIAEAAAIRERTAPMETALLARPPANGVRRAEHLDVDLINAYNAWRRADRACLAAYKACEDAENAYEASLPSRPRYLMKAIGLWPDGSTRLRRATAADLRARVAPILVVPEVKQNLERQLAELAEHEACEARLRVKFNLDALESRSCSAEQAESDACDRFVDTPARTAAGVALKLKVAIDYDGQTSPWVEAALNDVIHLSEKWPIDHLEDE